MPRTSARANKGQHSQRSLQEVLLQEREEASSSEPSRKRARIDSDLDDYDGQDGQDGPDSSENDDSEREGDNERDELETENAAQKLEDNDGDVRCTPCGTNKENYNEETDEGGTMIECDSCHTWQHARCMGYRTKRSIPKQYVCNLCLTEKGRDAKGETPAKNAMNSGSRAVSKAGSKPEAPGYSFTLRDKTRISVAKAFFGVFSKNIPAAILPEGIDAAMMATKWAQELESEVCKHFPQKDKHYTDKSRGLMVLIKKENVMRRISSGELSFFDLVNSLPEEIDDDLKVYAEKVRQESIRRSVLTVEEGLQRIRRTHKGEEIVEDASHQLEEPEVNVVARNIDHRRIKEDLPVREIIANPEPLTYYHQEDDEEEPEEPEKEESEEEAAAGGADASDSDLDDEIDMILKDKKEESKEETAEPKVSVEARQPEKLAIVPKKPDFPRESPEVWTGEITFPDFASFTGTGELKCCTGYVEPRDSQTARTYSKFIKVGKELLPRKKHEVEGRLDKKRADDYLAQVVSSRDLYVVEIKPTGNYPGYEKLYEYLLDREKVGVLSGKPSFAKDSYLIALEKSRPIPGYLSALKMEPATGLFALYVVRRGYVPAAPSILKHRPASVQTPSVPLSGSHNVALSVPYSLAKPMLPQPPSMAAKPSTPLLDSILSTLGGQSPAQTAPKPQNSAPKQPMIHPSRQQNSNFLNQGYLGYNQNQYNQGFNQNLYQNQYQNHNHDHSRNKSSSSYNKVASLPGKPNLPSKPTFTQQPQTNQQNLNLSGDQMRYLQELVRSNPQDTSALSNSGSGSPANDDDEFPTYN